MNEGFPKGGGGQRFGKNSQIIAFKKLTALHKKHCNKVESCTMFFYRYVTQGMVKQSTNDVYWEVMGLRRRMACARLGFES